MQKFSDVSFVPTSLALAISSALLFTIPLTSYAEDELADTYEVITVVAHRQARQQSEVTGTVTVIDEHRMQRELALDVADLIRYEPGIDIDQGSTRFGHGGFTIRGIGGNRSSIVIDNVPVGDGFSVGNFSDTGRGLSELGLISRVEVLRGPASTLYGSKALGGVVAFSMLDIDDVIRSGDFGGFVNVSGQSDRDRYRATAATAWQQGDYGFLIAGAHQRANEPNLPSSPDVQDQLDQKQDAILLRFAKETDRARLRISFDSQEEKRESDILALLGQGRFAMTTLMTGDDTRDQWRFVIDQYFQNVAGIDRGNWRIWRQMTNTRQDTYEERRAAPVPISIERDFEFQQKAWGVGSDLENDLQLGGFKQRLGYGFELIKTQVADRRDGLQTNLMNGSTTTIILGEQFPLRDFPNSDVTELGVYVHDEIQLWSAGPTLSPGLRYEYYKLNSTADDLYTSAFPNTEVTDLSESRWLPKLGLLWPLQENLDWFVQYAEGFRAPPFSDVNIGLYMPMMNLVAIPNPDLKSEKGRTIETGLRWQNADSQLEVVFFRNHYRDFIETRAALGFDPARGMLVFQSQNRDRVCIEGAEMRARQSLGNFFEVRVAAEITRGYEQGASSEENHHLSEVAPARATVELAWLPNMHWESRLFVQASRGQRDLVDASGAALFSAPGYTTVDWVSQWLPNETWSVTFGVFNLTDKTYWRQSGSRLRPANDPYLPLWVEPGRSVGASVTMRF
ncbi:MAG: TonB-dependent receptor [Aliidiomarina sp.]|uniref:TonB-dependent receptor domain-containing protein n=1 Tax=Aliidiomarina sp. TaxID=1872439 RepID=UPI0025BBA4F0|nr:TonB-dependent receptor [Aliidiomarina sp.]MCH8501145.1 TonB-dependent receptor [Aliidiomarina sp.]